jgi:hypothetical protein
MMTIWGHQENLDGETVHITILGQHSRSDFNLTLLLDVIGNEGSDIHYPTVGMGMATIKC